MSCPHGNHEDDCALCAADSAAWDAGYAAGRAAAVEFEATLLYTEVTLLRAENEALKKDALCWKRLAERHYAARAYPANQHLAEGSLDAYFKAHRDEILAAERKEEGK